MKKILALLFMLFAATAYAIPPMPSGTPPVGTITGLFTGEGDYLKSDGTKGTPSGSGDVVGPAASTQYKIPLWGAADKTLVDGVAVGTEGMLLRSAGSGAYPAWSAYTLALPGAAGAVLYSDGTNWTRSTAPSLLALTLYGQSAGGGAQLSLGSSSGSSDPNNGKMNFRNSTNGYLFTITSGVTGADIGWTLPTAAPVGANYLLNVDADGTMGYTDPSTFISDNAYDATSWNGVTTIAPSKNAVRDYLETKMPSGADGAYGLTLSNNSASWTPGAGTYGFGFVAGVPKININNVQYSAFYGVLPGTMTNGYLCTYTSSDTLLSCNTNPSTFQTADADLSAIAALSCTENQILKKGASAWECGTDNTGAGGSVAISGTPSIHQWGVWTDGTTQKGVSVTASKAVCSDSNGEPVACTNLTDIAAISSSSTDTLTNKTLDVDGTGNTLKTWGYLVLTHPHVCSSGAAMQTTSTANTFGQCKFGNATDKATNYAEYYFVVPPDIDTSVDLVGTFKFKLGGADTGDHEYEISFDSVADSAAYAGSLGDAVSLAYTADASGAGNDVETATGTLTGWRSAMTGGQLMVVRVARDGDHANDASTVDSYSGPLVIKYKISQ
jgi:hypothetical protein